MGSSDTEHVFELVGGALCLDFANTVSSYLAEPDERGDHLLDYPALLSWSAQAGVIDSATLARLGRLAARRPAEAARVHADALALRAVIQAAFDATAHGKRASAETLATLSRFHARSAAREHLVAKAGGYQLECACDEDALDQMLWPIARSVIELLTSDRHTRVRLCEAASQATCTWLFVDESKNHSRRWCSMRDCGNRAKVRRHYERRKRAPARS